MYIIKSRLHMQLRANFPGNDSIEFFFWHFPKFLQNDLLVWHLLRKNTLSSPRTIFYTNCRRELVAILYSIMFWITRSKRISCPVASMKYLSLTYTCLSFISLWKLVVLLTLICNPIFSILDSETLGFLIYWCIILLIIGFSSSM